VSGQFSCKYGTFRRMKKIQIAKANGRRGPQEKRGTDLIPQTMGQTVTALRMA